MNRLAGRPRIGIALTFLVIVPWLIVLAATIRVAYFAELPEFEAADAAELAALSRALHAYAAMYGEYPPDFTSGNPRQEIDDHLQKLFPLRDKQKDVPSYVADLGPENALAFWLQGRFENNPRYPLTGTVSRDQIPITEEEILAEIYENDSIELLTSKGFVPGSGLEDTETYQELTESYFNLQKQQRKQRALLRMRKPLFNFDKSRLSLQDEYRPRCCRAPLVYFRADNYDRSEYQGERNWGLAQPYRAVTEHGQTGFTQPGRFQIICAGRDGSFGTEAIVAADAASHVGHADNLTSFANQPLGMAHHLAQRRQAMTVRNLSPLIAVACCFGFLLTLALRHEEDGIVILTRNIRRQYSVAECSEPWMRLLEIQRQQRRGHALNRLKAPARSEVRHTQIESRAAGRS